MSSATFPRRGYTPDRRTATERRFEALRSLQRIPLSEREECTGRLDDLLALPGLDLSVEEMTLFRIAWTAAWYQRALYGLSHREA